MPKNKKTIIISALALIIVLAAGYALSRRLGLRGQSPAAPTTETGKQAALEGLATPPEPKQIFSYQGEVTTIGNNQLTVLAQPAFNSLAQDTALTVTIADATKIERLQIIPGSATLPKSGRPLPPKFKHAPLSLSDIKIGDTVIASSGEDIKNKTEFAAARIEVIE